MMLSVDPGLNACGVALWDGQGKLKRAELVVNPAKGRQPDTWRAMAREVCQVGVPEELVIEIPQVYRRSLSKGDPNDLIQLAAVVGAVTMCLSTKTFSYLPAEWKGQLPKEVVEERTKRDLSDEEREKIVLPSRSLQHNVWDAIALGLFHLSRTRKRP